MPISKLKLERIKMCLGEDRLAQKMGVSWSTIRLWENGLVEPNAEQKRRLCDIFRLHERVLFPIKPEPEVPEPEED